MHAQAAPHYHQQVAKTRWWVFLTFQSPCQPPPPSTHPLATTHAQGGLNESPRLIGGVYPSRPTHAGLYDHQRVTITRWWVFSLSTNPCRFPPPQTSLRDSLVGLLPFHRPMLASTTTNKSLRLISGVSPSRLTNAGFHNHQQVSMTRWWVFSLPTD